MTEERWAHLGLAAIVEPGHPAVSQAVAEYGAEAVWGSITRPESELPLSRRARALDLPELVERTQKLGFRFLIPSDEDWPQALNDLGGCEPVNQLSGIPLGLWVSGPERLAELTRNAVSIVGARASTAYGETVAAELAAELSQSGWTVISGGAYGIDASAHRGALASTTPTVAVLAGGLDELYPAGNRTLLNRIAETGLLVTELAPGERPSRVRFLARNRLIAALAKGTVIVEAAARSGARNTVTWANELGRPVLAVPGPVTSANSVTPHRLIRDAEAVLITRATDVLEVVGPLGQPNPRQPGVRRPTDSLSADELRLFEAVPGRGALPAAELALRAGLPLPRCLALLDSLAERGFLNQHPSGDWRLPPLAG